MSKWKTIDSAPMGVTVWAKVEGVSSITGKPYEKCKVVLNQMSGSIVARMEYEEAIDYLPIEDSDTESCWPLTHWKPVKQSKWIVKNSGKLKLREMSEEDAYEVFKAWRKDVGADEKALYVYDWDGYWVEYLNDSLFPYSIYRVKRQDVPEGVVEEDTPL